MLLNNLKSTLLQAGKGLLKILGWLLAGVMFAINMYQFYDSLELEKKLNQAEERINSAQTELQKAQLYLDEMENELKAFEVKDEEMNEEIEALIVKWREGLVSMKRSLNPRMGGAGND